MRVGWEHNLILFSPRDCATASTVANLPGHLSPIVSLLKLQKWRSLEVQKKYQKHRIVEMISKIISVPTVVCTLELIWWKWYLIWTIGTPLFGGKVNSDGELDGVAVVRAGIFDDIRILDERKPDVEIYTISRLKWINPVEGAHQFSGMFSL
jgi:hypothetical protein